MYQDAVLDYLFPSKERLSWNEGHEEGLVQGKVWVSLSQEKLA